MAEVLALVALLVVAVAVVAAVHWWEVKQSSVSRQSRWQQLATVW